MLMIWSSLGVFGAITTAVNYAWKVERQPNYFKHKMVAFLMLVASSVLLLAALVLISAGSLIEARWFANAVGTLPARVRRITRRLATEGKSRSATAMTACE